MKRVPCAVFIILSTFTSLSAVDMSRDIEAATRERSERTTAAAGPRVPCSSPIGDHPGSVLRMTFSSSLRGRRSTKRRFHVRAGRAKACNLRSSGVFCSTCARSLVRTSDNLVTLFQSEAVEISRSRVH